MQAQTAATKHVVKRKRRKNDENDVGKLSKEIPKKNGVY